MRGDLDLAREPRSALSLQEIVLDPLQVQRTHDQHEEEQRECTEQHERAGAGELDRCCNGLSRRGSHRPPTLAAAANADSPTGSAPGAGVVSGAAGDSMTCTRDGAGNCMCSDSRAIFSTRAGIAQVDCSSESWPNSTSNWRACERSRSSST